MGRFLGLPPTESADDRFHESLLVFPSALKRFSFVDVAYCRKSDALLKKFGAQAPFRVGKHLVELENWNYVTHDGSAR